MANGKPPFGFQAGLDFDKAKGHTYGFAVGIEFAEDGQEAGEARQLEPVGFTEFESGLHGARLAQYFISAIGFDAATYGTAVAYNKTQYIKPSGKSSSLSFGVAQVENLNQVISGVTAGNFLSLGTGHTVINRNKYITDVAVGKQDAYGVATVWNSTQIITAVSFNATTFGSATNIYNKTQTASSVSVGDTAKFGTHEALNRNRHISNVTVGNSLAMGSGHTLKNLNRKLNIPSIASQLSFGLPEIDTTTRKATASGFVGTAFGTTKVEYRNRYLSAITAGSFAAYGQPLVFNKTHVVKSVTLGDTSLISENAELASTNIDCFPSGFDASAFGVATAQLYTRYIEQAGGTEATQFGNGKVENKDRYLTITAGAQSAFGTSNVFNKNRTISNVGDAYDGDFGENVTVSLRVRAVVVTQSNTAQTQYGNQKVSNKNKVLSIQGFASEEFGGTTIDGGSQEIQVYDFLEHTEFGTPKINDGEIAPASIASSVKFGSHKISDFNQYVGVTGSDMLQINGSGKTQTEVQHFHRHIFPIGHNSVEFGKSDQNDKPYQYQSLHVGFPKPTKPDGFEAVEFGNQTVGHHTRTISPAGIDPTDSYTDFWLLPLEMLNLSEFGSSHIVKRKGEDEHGRWRLISNVSCGEQTLTGIAGAMNKNIHIRPDGNTDMFRKGVPTICLISD